MSEWPPATAGVTAESIEAYIAEVWPAAAGSTEVLEVSGRHAVVRRRVDPASLRPGAMVSGPTQFGMADVALWFAVALTLFTGYEYLRDGEAAARRS